MNEIRNVLKFEIRILFEIKNLPALSADRQAVDRADRFQNSKFLSFKF